MRQFLVKSTSVILFNHKAKQWKTNSNDASQLEDSSWKTNLFLVNQISHTMSKDIAL